tara:strand:+ start:236 stop:532 length:297 start_codon:yes stop_codon:yes gene_type:complete
MIVKAHKTEDGRLLLAVCDSDIIGKKFEEGKKQLDLSSDFYKGEEKSDKETTDLMRNAYIINIVGKNAVTLAINENLISGDNVEEINGIPYAQSIGTE